MFDDLIVLDKYSKVFPSFDEAKTNILKFAKDNNFGLKQSKCGDGRYRFKCTMAGKTSRSSKEFPKFLKNTPSRCDCKFAINLRLGDDSNWIAESSLGCHNHGPRVLTNIHSHRRLEENAKDRIKADLLHVSPLHIKALEETRNPDALLKRRDIYNIAQEQKRNERQNLSALEYVFKELACEEFLINVMTGEDGSLAAIFFAEMGSIKLLKCYSAVLSMDSTYKVLSWDLPLLNIVGQDCHNRTFFVASCIMARETQLFYEFALGSLKSIIEANGISSPEVIFTDRELALVNALKTTFPMAKNVICSWHLRKMVCAKLKNCLENDVSEAVSDFDKLIYANTVPEYETAWNCFLLKYENHAKVINYLQRTWIPYKQHWSRAYLRGYLTSGRTASSRAESAHSLLKRWLRHSKGDIDRFFKIYKQLNDEIAKSFCIQTDISKYSNKYANRAELCRVKGKVSLYLCDLIVKQVQSYEQTKACNCHEIEEYGYPCACHIEEHGLQLHDVNTQFWLNEILFNVVNPFPTPDASIVKAPPKKKVGNSSGDCKARKPHFLDLPQPPKTSIYPPPVSDGNAINMGSLETISLKLPKKLKRN